jgi:hypothetical protein
LCHLLLSIDHRGIDLGAIYWLVSGPYSAPTLCTQIINWLSFTRETEDRNVTASLLANLHGS